MRSSKSSVQITTIKGTFSGLGSLVIALVIGEKIPGIQFYVGLTIMIIATVLMVKDTIGLQHTHEHSHEHTHIHGEDESIHDHRYEGDDGEAHFHEHTV